LEEAGLTHTYRDVVHFCKLEIIDYLVLRYLNTGAPPFEEWAEEWMNDGEAYTSYTREKVFGGDLIWRAFA